jgi:hypothetical protein
MEIRERPPSMQKTSMAGPLIGGDGDPRAPTINAKKLTAGPLTPWGSDLHSGSERCVVNLHGYDRQKVIMHTGSTFPTTGHVMADDP